MAAKPTKPKMTGKATAPGQRAKTEGGTARSYAPGQIKKKSGGR